MSQKYRGFQITCSADGLGGLCTEWSDGRVRVTAADHNARFCHESAAVAFAKARIDERYEAEASGIIAELKRRGIIARGMAC